MEPIEKATKTKYEMEVKHKRIRPTVPKRRVMPSPNRYSEHEEEAQHDQGIEEEQHLFQQQPPAHTDLTGSPDRSNQFSSGQHGSSSSQRKKPTSPIRKMFNFFLGRCNTIDVREHKERQRRNKDTLRLKKLQAKLTPDDPPSPIGSEGQECNTLV
jgi:hypothetical protein